VRVEKKRKSKNAGEREIESRKNMTHIQKTKSRDEKKYETYFGKYFSWVCVETERTRKNAGDKETEKCHSYSNTKSEEYKQYYWYLGVVLHLFR